MKLEGLIDAIREDIDIENVFELEGPYEIAAKLLGYVGRIAEEHGLSEKADDLIAEARKLCTKAYQEKPEKIAIKKIYIKRVKERVQARVNSLKDNIFKNFATDFLDYVKAIEKATRGD